jgi:hypothetical protein
MKKTSYFLICIFFIFSTYSCGLLLGIPERELVDVEIINETNESIDIYYYDDIWVTRIQAVMIKPNDWVLIMMWTEKPYYAEGRDSKKEYGEYRTPSPPSNAPPNYDVPKTKYAWVIKE